jgi:hypothetical protein
MERRSLTSKWNGLKTQYGLTGSWAHKLISLFAHKSRSLLCILCIALAGISAAAYPQESSVLKAVPAATLVCVRFANPRDFDGKVTNLVDSLNIPNMSSVSIAQLIGKMTDSDVESLMDLEDAGFNMKSDGCVFWTSLSSEKFSIVVHVSSRQQAEASVRHELGGTDKQYKGVTYALSDASSAWVFLEDIFVYSKDKGDIMDVIETHLKEKRSILQDEKYLASIEGLRSGDLSGYVALDKIASTYLPLLKSEAEKAKKALPEQMKKQEATSPAINFDVAKILGAEIDIGLWILQQFRCYAISLGVGMDGIWANDSLKFRPDSPICDFLNTSPGRLELVRYLPDDVLIAGGATMDIVSVEKIYSLMFNVLRPILQEKMAEEEITRAQRKYEVGIHRFLSCFGGEVAFAVLTKVDKAIPKAVYILEITDRDKAQRVMEDFDYMMEISEPFCEAFGMEIQMTEGPAQRYAGVQVRSLQMDLSKMASSVPNAGTMYPEKLLLWYASVDDKMIYSISQSADTIKGAIDAIEGRKSGIVNSPNFGDIDIRLPEKSNAVIYVSPAGYLKFITSMMMSQMGQSMPGGTMAEKSDIGFAVTTNLDGDGIRNFTYLLMKEIQGSISTGLGLSGIMKTQK